MTKRTVHYVLSTHWDREWYQAFQHFRYRLVQVLDEVIAGLQDGRLKGPFTTMGRPSCWRTIWRFGPSVRTSCTNC